MLRSLKSLVGQPISARDGLIGDIHDFLFDDDSWNVRYLVVDTGHWLPGRKVLLTPQVVGEVTGEDDSVPIDLTQEEIKSSPDIDTDKPVSRQHEIELHRHFSWPYYWTPAVDLTMPMALPPPQVEDSPPYPDGASQAEGDEHLHSLRAVDGYKIEARDGSIGHADDLVVDVPAWAIRYLVVDTSKWLPGRRVLVAPDWSVERFNWGSRTVTVDLTRDQVKECPEFDPSAGINRDYEARLYDYYGRPAYWTDHHLPASRR